MTPGIRRIVAAVTGSPLETLAVCAGRVMDDYALQVTTLTRAPFGPALQLLPQALPFGFPRVAVLVDCSDWVGGPILAKQMAAQRRDRPWTLASIQLIADGAISQTHGWRTDVPRRDVIAALVDSMARGRLRIPKGTSEAESVKEGLKGLRAKRDAVGAANPNEDLALVLALCAWFAVCRTPRRQIAGYVSAL